MTERSDSRRSQPQRDDAIAEDPSADAVPDSDLREAADSPDELTIHFGVSPELGRLLRSYEASRRRGMKAPGPNSER